MDPAVSSISLLATGGARICYWHREEAERPEAPGAWQQEAPTAEYYKHSSAGRELSRGGLLSREMNAVPAVLAGKAAIDYFHTTSPHVEGLREGENTSEWIFGLTTRVRCLDWHRVSCSPAPLLCMVLLPPTQFEWARVRTHSRPPASSLNRSQQPAFPRCAAGAGRGRGARRGVCHHLCRLRLEAPGGCGDRSEPQAGLQPE